MHIDDEDDQEIFLMALKEISGFITYTSSYSAQEAIRKIMVKEINPDIIFLDLNMSIMSGQLFLVEIKQDYY